MGLKMKRKKTSFFVATLAIAAFLTGCGTPLNEMTLEEEDLFVAYTVKMVSKHNIYQNDGVTFVDKNLLKPDAPVVIVPDEPNTENDIINPGNADGENPSTVPDTPVNENAVLVSQALGLPASITITKSEMKVDSHFKDGKVSSATANAGNKFVILNFELTSTADENIDIMSLDPKFKLMANGESYSQKITVLPSDLATFVGEVNAEDTKTLILLFEMSTAKAEAITDYSLTLSVNGANYTIK